MLIGDRCRLLKLLIGDPYSVSGITSQFSCSKTPKLK